MLRDCWVTITTTIITIISHHVDDSLPPFHPSWDHVKQEMLTQARFHDAGTSFAKSVASLTKYTNIAYNGLGYWGEYGSPLG